nr:hypothetical protein [Micromonospora sp. DSM 115978]
MEPTDARPARKGDELRQAADAARDAAIETRIRQALDLGQQSQTRLAPPWLDNRRPHRYDGSLRKEPAGGGTDDR